MVLSSTVQRPEICYYYLISDTKQIDVITASCNYSPIILGMKTKNTQPQLNMKEPKTPNMNKGSPQPAKPAWTMSNETGRRDGGSGTGRGSL